MNMVRPTSGKLLLWNGPAGTGKTYALRALAQAWSPWCELHYVSDPEALLGSEPEYLMEVILQEPDEEDGDGEDEPAADGRAKWRLLVLEDAGDLIAIDARERVGEALSRLLNLSDGILGQGLHLLTLITTNEEVGKLNPAVQRPGRCLAITTFHALSIDEAAQWAAARDIGLPEARERWTLADLYALTRGSRVSLPEQSAGFRPR